MKESSFGQNAAVAAAFCPFYVSKFIQIYGGSQILRRL
jgi:hypothetical protein